MSFNFHLHVKLQIEKQKAAPKSDRKKKYGRKRHHRYPSKYKIAYSSGLVQAFRIQVE